MRAGRTMVVGVALVALAGCSGDGDDVGVDPGAIEESVPADLPLAEDPAEDTGDDAADDGVDDDAAGGAAGDGPSVEVAETPLGDVLVDAEGMSLYIFDPDEQGESTCYDDCATAWPPLLVEGEPVVGEGLDEAMIGTVERTDGTVQVTYNSWPLYYWQNDAAPGDLTGQAVNDVWWVVGPDGEPVRTEPTS